MNRRGPGHDRDNTILKHTNRNGRTRLPALNNLQDFSEGRLPYRKGALPFIDGRRKGMIV